MKKIRFGCFPLIDVSESNRHCIDTYSIKSFADLITLNTQMTHINSDTQQYITPAVIMKYFASSRVTEERGSFDEQTPQGKALVEKIRTMKRAFNSLKTFNKAIAGNTFYRNLVTYPIYIEHQAKEDSHDYDFILLSNDLQQKEILDEIKYDDKVTLTFLFLKDMLYPKTPLSEMGVKDGYNIRSDMARFIEYSRKNNTDPISTMIKLIKIAGRKKAKQKTSYNGLISFATANKALTEVIPEKLFKLFGGDRHSGEIKDITFLLNEIDHVKIAEFFDDTTAQNRGAHSSDPRSPEYSSEIERQYNAQKTQEYNKILSMVDSLMRFNSVTDIMIDVASEFSDNKLQLASDAPGQNGYETVSINYDKLLNSVRNTYFDTFIGSLLTKMDMLLLRTTSATQVTGQADLGLSNIKTLDELIAHLELEIMSKEQERDALIYDEHGNKDAIQILTNTINSERNHLREAALKQTFYMQDTADAAQKQYNQQTSQLKYNAQLIQGELAGFLHDFEATLYNIDIYQELIEAIGNRKTFKEEDLFNIKAFREMQFARERLAASLYDSLYQTTMTYDGHKEFNVQSDNLSKIDSYFKKHETEFKNMISKFLIDNLMNMYRSLGREYGDINSHRTQQFANLRAEKNTIIRKTVMKPTSFKTFILSESVLIALYKILNHVDNQKYIAGLIAYPPSQISNDLNKIKYCIKRLGLEENPVFIINEQNGSVILSSPDDLSLTGSKIYSKISMQELRAICSIDYARDLWNDQAMFAKANGALNNNKLNKDITSKAQDLAKVQEILKELEGSSDKKARERALKKVSEAQKNLDRVQSKLENASYALNDNIASNMATAARPIRPQRQDDRNFNQNRNQNQNRNGYDQNRNQTRNGYDQNRNQTRNGYDQNRNPLSNQRPQFDPNRRPFNPNNDQDRY